MTNIAQPTERDEDSDLLVVDRIEREIREEIAQRHFAPGTMLPKQDALVGRYQVSKGSIRRALERLKRDNVIQSIRGKGTFILDPQRRLKDIILISHGPHFTYQTLLSNAISHHLHQFGRTVSLVNSDDPAAEWPSILRKRIDSCGVILAGSFTRDKILRLVKRATVPVVSLTEIDEPHRSAAACHAVLPDYRAIAYRCVEYFVRRGHKKIALLDWELEKPNGRDILLGYRQALDAFGLDYNEDWVVDLPKVPLRACELEAAPPSQAQVARERFSGWKTSGHLPTALIHGSGYECTITDIINHCMDGHFSAQNVLGHMFTENLSASYRGLGPMTAFCTSIGTMVQQALDLIKKVPSADEPPIRYTLEHIRLYKRFDGLWKEQPLE